MALTDSEKGNRLASSLPLDGLDRLARLYAEARQTNRLARLLVSAVHAAFFFMLAAILVLVLGKTQAIWRGFSWALMILVGVLALLRCHIRSHAALFAEGPSLEAARRLRLSFLYMGIAWGAGAFFVLPAGSETLSVSFFMTFPALALALLIPDAASVALFLVPSGLMVIGAVLIRTFPHTELDMSLILILQWGLFSGAVLRNREPLPAAPSQG